MNTSKDDFEWQIRKQIEEREIAPSRDLWSEIELQSENKTVTKSVNWFLVAACIVLSCSLGTVLFLLKDSSYAQPELVKQTPKHDLEQVIVRPVQEKAQLAEHHTPKKDVKNVSIPKETEDMAALPVMKESKIHSKEIISEKKNEILRIQAPKILANIDSSKVQIKKKKYVDPSTLLFSVEHKDVIEKTKGGSNVATIELNTK